ncbi:unnamed protein product [Acanthoscelides obtectus]|uniref:Uncharacterized protein n=1 Tax=Acanthoscelides obtectus TaxID=200917 RepID=A0A9P0Q4P2_ACAOB|nr:unnamed protein product [Acanthoscelides obtectus]CAK1680416.1 hypothetical protein AOBTE_LOCUS32637 [Acanthoscelides obtectus]
MSSQKVIDAMSDEFVRRIEMNVLSSKKRFQKIHYTKPNKRIRPTTISKRQYNNNNNNNTHSGTQFCDNCGHYFCFCRESVAKHSIGQTASDQQQQQQQQQQLLHQYKQVELYCDEELPKS